MDVTPDYLQNEVMVSWVRRNCRFAQSSGSSDLNDIISELSAMGFGGHPTGGGCAAMIYDFGGKGRSIMVTDDDCNLPSDGEMVAVGYYEGENQKDWGTFYPDDYDKIIPTVRRFIGLGSGVVPQESPGADPEGRMYDLYGKGGNKTPEEASELAELVRRHGKPRYMASRKSQGVTDEVQV